MRYWLFALLLIAVYVFAASGDWVAPTANYDEGDFTETDSIYASDNRRTHNVGELQHRVGGKGFGIAVTDSSTIDSILVKIEGNGNSSTANRRDITVQLSKDGGATGVGDAVTVRLKQTTDTIITVRGSTNGLWNTTWTEAEIESANLTVNAKKVTAVTSADICIDQITVQVWYTVPAVPGSLSPYRNGPLGADVQAGPQGASRRAGP